VGHRVEVDEHGRWKVVFFDEPKYIRALMIAPEAREPELESGAWLIVVFAVWSGHDRRAVCDAVAFAKEYGGVFQLGARPYDFPEELRSWWPQPSAPIIGKSILTLVDEPDRKEIHISGDPTGSPAWLILKDGQVVHQAVGRRSKSELRQMVQGILHSTELLPDSVDP
jgi:hypothetical protein